jgi:hypothetical protein
VHSVENPGNAAEETFVSRKIELVFAAFFALFFIGWLTFDIPVALGFVYKGTGWYAFAYGPFYAATAYGFIRRSSWLPYVVLPLAGMEVATVGIYFVEELTGDVQPWNWTMFYILNGPYIVVTVLAALWLIARTRKTAFA